MPKNHKSHRKMINVEWHRPAGMIIWEVLSCLHLILILRYLFSIEFTRHASLLAFWLWCGNDDVGIMTNVFYSIYIYIFTGLHFLCVNNQNPMASTIRKTTNFNLITTVPIFQQSQLSFLINTIAVWIYVSKIQAHNP